MVMVGTDGQQVDQGISALTDILFQAK